MALDIGVCAFGVVSTRVTPSSFKGLSSFVDIHGTPLQLPGCYLAYQQLGKSEKADIKRPLPYFIGGFCGSGRRAESIKSRSLITLDIEQLVEQRPPPNPSEVSDLLEFLGMEGWVYTSISHTPEKPRYRVVLPLANSIMGDGLQQVFKATSLSAASRLNLTHCTAPESFVVPQPMFLPAHLAGAPYFSSLILGQSWGTCLPGVVLKPSIEAADPVVAALQESGMYIGASPSKGHHYFRCPNPLHSMESDTKTVYMEAHYSGKQYAAVRCMGTSPDVGGVPHMSLEKLKDHLHALGHFTLGSTHEIDRAEEMEFNEFDELSNLSNLLAQPTQDREWAISGLAPIGKVTVVAGPGGVSKSMLLLTLLAQAAKGQNWAGFEVPRELKSLYISYEDDTQELQRRVWSITKGFPADNLQIFSADTNPRDWVLVEKPDRWGSERVTARMGWLTEYVASRGIKLVAFDPVVYMHTLEENDIAQMAFFMQALSTLAKEAGCAVVLVHHMSKTGSWGTLAELNQSSLRGASSIADNSRSVLAVVPVNPKDALSLGVPVAECSEYLVAKHLKHNYSKPLALQILKRVGGGMLEPIQNISAQLQDSQAAAEKLAEGEILDFLQERGKAAKVTEVRAACSASSKNFSSAFEALKASGRIHGNNIIGFCATGG
jgi:RecA-family ATPase